MTLVGEVATTVNLLTVAPGDMCGKAAHVMREEDVGDVVVVDEEGRPLGIVTDRDLAVRVVGEHLDPYETPVERICTDDLVTVKVDDSIDAAVALMAEHAIRRLPMVDGEGRLKGMVSLGDLAIREDPESALADISKAPAQE